MQHKAEKLNNQVKLQSSWSGERCASRCNELSTEFEGLKLDLVISESKIDNKIRINGDAINQVQAEFAIIQNQLGEVVQQVDRLVNTNENDNTMQFC